MRALNELKPVVEAKLQSLGLELYDMRFFSAGARSILRIYIDKEEGATIADCERASSELSMLLDVENFSNRPYTLEVSTPGADRLLTTERDFKRNIGRVVSLTVSQMDGTKKPLDGKVISCENGSLMLQTEDEHEQSIALKDIAGAKIKLPF